MKIFNWVHRRFNQKHEYGQDTAKVELTGNGKADKLALLETAAMDGMFDGWNEGIFSIGTFGFDPTLSKDIEYEEEYCLQKELFDEDENDHDGGDHGREMELPLVLKACNHGFFDDFKDEKYSQCDEISSVKDQGDGIEDTGCVKMGKKEGERITLADLFLADSEKNALKNEKLCDEDHVIKVEVGSNATEFDTKHGLNDDRVCLISKKKLIKDDATRPMKKINRIMKKMLKKKIHPNIENQTHAFTRMIT